MAALGGSKGAAPVKGGAARGAPKVGVGQRGGGGVKAPPKAPAPKPPTLSQQAHATANAATAGPISELAKQIATNNQSNQAGQGQDFGYYMQLAQAAKDAVGTQQSIGTGLQSQLQGIAANTQSQIGNLGAQQQGGAVGRMNALGLGGDSSGQLAAATAQQQGVGALNAQTAQMAGANQSANYASNAANTQGVVGLSGEQQIGNLASKGAAANEPLNAKIATLQDKNGALYQTALGQLQKLQQSYTVAEQGLGVKQQTANTTAANDQAKNKLTGQKNQITLSNDTTRNRITAQNDQALQQLHAATLQNTRQNDQANQRLKQEALNIKASGSQKPLSSVSNNLANTKINEIISAIQTWQQQGMKNSKGVVQVVHPTDAQMRRVLGQTYEGPLIEAGFDLLGYGYLTQQTAAALHGMGVRGTTYKGQPARVVNPNARGGANAVANASNGSNLGLG